MPDIFDVLYQHPVMRSTASLTDRLDFLTTFFLGRPYILGAQGEGAQGEFDQFPLYRFDGFDCVTFVNNVLALARSRNEADFLQQLLYINYYDANPCYENRFHFMSLDWNPQNSQHKIISDITETILDKKQQPIALFAEGIIDKKNWLLYRTEKDLRLDDPQDLAAKLVKLHALAQVFEPKQVRMPYLPIATLLAHPEYLSQLPEASIIEIVRPNWALRDKIGTNLHVSHLGFCFRAKQSEMLFRHASSDEKAVVEIPLLAYLSRFERSETIKGISVFSVN